MREWRRRRALHHHRRRPHLARRRTDARLVRRLDDPYDRGVAHHVALLRGSSVEAVGLPSGYSVGQRAFGLPSSEPFDDKSKTTILFVIPIICSSPCSPSAETPATTSWV